MQFDNDLTIKEKEMRVNASRNIDFSELRRLVDLKRNELSALESELDDLNRKIETLDDKLSGQTLLEKRRQERGFEAEKDFARVKND